MCFLKNNDNVSRKRALSILFLIFTSFLIVGCSANSIAEGNGAKVGETVDKSEQAIRAVIEKEFNGPDEKYKELWDAATEAQTSEKYMDDYEAYLESPEYQALASYMKETYASYFTDHGYEKFINEISAFRYSIFDQEYKLDSSHIEIVQKEMAETHDSTLYDFTFEVEYTDENGESQRFHFKGKASAPEEGILGGIQYSDGDKLLQEIRNNEYK